MSEHKRRMIIIAKDLASNYGNDVLAGSRCLTTLIGGICNDLDIYDDFSAEEIEAITAEALRQYWRVQKFLGLDAQEGTT